MVYRIDADIKTQRKFISIISTQSTIGCKNNTEKSIPVLRETIFIFLMFISSHEIT